MAAKFYRSDFGLKIEVEDDEELTEQEAMIVAVRDLAFGMSQLADAMWNIRDEFAGKSFYDENRPAAPPAPAAPSSAKRAAKKSAKRGAAKKRAGSKKGP